MDGAPQVSGSFPEQGAPHKVEVMFPLDLLDALDDYAARRYLPRAVVIRSAVARYLREELRRDGESTT